MKRYVYPVFMTIALGALAACDTPAVSGSSDSGVRNLSQGMTYDQVRAILGAHQAGTITPDVAGATCLTWVYDEMVDAKFIHATFENNVLQSARDGFRAICDGR